MAAYPTSVPFRTTVVAKKKNRVRFAEDGTPRLQDLAAETGYEITVKHLYCTEAEVATLQAFYNANKSSNNTIIARGRTYDFNFVNDYTEKEIEGILAHVTIKLAANRQ